MAAPNPVMIGISALTSIGAGMAAKRAAKKQAAQARAIGQYNASIIKRNLQEELTVFRATGSQLTKSQREFKAQQKMKRRWSWRCNGWWGLVKFLRKR